ncbi:MAG: hypothetical protein QME87_14620 [Bacillota bacterium]|nr:hypothetical protein [Bacillota bacterium]
MDIDGTVARVYPLVLRALGPSRAKEFRESRSYRLPLAGRREEVFFRVHSWIFRLARPEPGAAAVLRGLAGCGAQLFYVSSRPFWAGDVTCKWLARWGFPPGQVLVCARHGR